MYALAILTLGICSNVLASYDGFAVKDSHPVPRGWHKVGLAPKHHVLDLHIGLTQGDFDGLERNLYEVSDPSSIRYGQHLTSRQVNDLVRPEKSTSDAVAEWLDEHGIYPSELEYNEAGDWISTSQTVEKVEVLLNTTYFVFQYEKTNTHVIRAPSWSLPSALHSYITTIQPTNSFFRATPRRKTSTPQVKRKRQAPAPQGINQVCNNFSVTPTCLRTLYNTINYEPQAIDKNRISLVNFLDEVSNRSDISIFLSNFRPEAVDAAKQFKTIVINHGRNSQAPDTPDELAVEDDLEGDLDANQIIGVSWPTPLLTYNTGGSPPFNPDEATPQNTNEPYLVWLKYILNQRNPPPVVSASYADNEQTVPPAFAQAVCREFAKLGARGVSLLFASGDDGAGQSGECFSNDGNNTRKFLPEFPPSCPYVTAVGATMGFKPEMAANDQRGRFTSGGGYSDYFGRPQYQEAAVSAYAKHIPKRYTGLYNPDGRAYPDVSAQGQRLANVFDGNVIVTDGTSASTPIFSGVIALVNDALIAGGHAPLGFLNPFIYRYGTRAFNDIVNGTGGGCNSDGFDTATGWDPVTGYGTPRFHRLVQLASAARSNKFRP